MYDTKHVTPLEIDMSDKDNVSESPSIPSSMSKMRIYKDDTDSVRSGCTDDTILIGQEPVHTVMKYELKSIPQELSSSSASVRYTPKTPAEQERRELYALEAQRLLDQAREHRRMVEQMTHYTKKTQEPIPAQNLEQLASARTQPTPEEIRAILGLPTYGESPIQQSPLGQVRAIAKEHMLDKSISPQNKRSIHAQLALTSTNEALTETMPQNTLPQVEYKSTPRPQSQHNLLYQVLSIKKSSSDPSLQHTASNMRIPSHSMHRQMQQRQPMCIAMHPQQVRQMFSMPRGNSIPRDHQASSSSSQPFAAGQSSPQSSPSKGHKHMPERSALEPQFYAPRYRQAHQVQPTSIAPRLNSLQGIFAAASRVSGIFGASGAPSAPSPTIPLLPLWSTSTVPGVGSSCRTSPNTHSPFKFYVEKSSSSPVEQRNDVNDISPAAHLEPCTTSKDNLSMLRSMSAPNLAAPNKKSAKSSPHKNKTNACSFFGLCSSPTQEEEHQVPHDAKESWFVDNNDDQVFDDHHPRITSPESIFTMGDLSPNLKHHTRSKRKKSKDCYIQETEPRAAVCNLFATSSREVHSRTLDDMRATLSEQ